MRCKFLRTVTKLGEMCEISKEITQSIGAFQIVARGGKRFLIPSVARNLHGYAYGVAQRDNLNCTYSQ
jgi:hypothetical protein